MPWETWAFAVKLGVTARIEFAILAIKKNAIIILTFFIY